MIGGNYQPRESVERCAASFGIGVVPIVPGMKGRSTP